MGKLIFIGLGLHGCKSISLRGLEEARRADEVYLDAYTSIIPGLRVEELEELLGRGVRTASRKLLEGRESRKLLRSAVEKTVALLVPGDPFVATTHISLALEAVDLGIRVEVIPGASIASAIAGATGLQIYKFGRSVTVTYPEEGFVSEVPYEVVKENLQRGLHTLLYLDVRVDEGRFMSVSEALRLLSEIEERRREGVFTEDRLVVGVARVGAPDSVVKAGPLKSMIDVDFGGPPHSIVVPGRLHFMEKEALVKLAGAPRSAVEKHGWGTRS